MRGIDRDSRHEWESRLYTESFERLANTMLGGLEPAERAANILICEVQRGLDTRLTPEDLLDVCRSLRANADIVLPIHGYGRRAKLRNGQAVAPKRRWMDLLDATETDWFYIDPVNAPTVPTTLELLRQVYALGHLRVIFHGDYIDH